MCMGTSDPRNPKRKKRPIRAGEELLVWYTVEDNPEITAALEEERASSLSRKNSHRAKRVRRKLLEKARQAGLGGFNKTSGTKPTVGGMWEVGEGVKEDDSDISQEVKEPCLVENTARKDGQGVSASVMNRGNWAEVEDEEEEEEDEEEEDCDDSNDHQTSQQSAVVDKQSGPTLTSESKSHNSSRAKLKISFAQQEQEVDPDEFEGNPQEESYPCHHCERHFSSRQGLERHIHIHGVGGQQAQLFKCRYCSKSFGSQVGRRRHERRHESALKKRPSSLAGSVSLLSPVVQTDSSPDCTSPMSHYAAIGSQFTQSSEMQRKEFDRPSVFDENGESKELHPCKYCNKAFGTHTNMRRHQRRIHERHLLPKGVRRKGMLLQEASTQQLGESPSASPPPVYVPSADTEDEADRDDYAIDISKNISENLSFYIDGKIVSTSAVSSCEVIEVDTRSAALFGLDTVIISPNQISQALKVEGRTSATRQISTSEQPAAKRRTSTPPLVTGLKVETDTTPSSSSSSSSNLLMGGLFQQATDPSTLQREKTVYLSPKLKQLLQTQDFQKSTIALLTESHRLATPLTVASLQGCAGKFKRRTGSPPSSPQLSPACKTESCKAEVASTHTLKVPKLESHSVPPPESLVDKDDGDLLNPSGNAAHSQASSSGEGDSCNQQPLDLSNTVSRRSDGLNTAHGDSALDLSFHRKPAVELESKGNPAQQSLIKKKKPNTSMLEKVLMNEYAGLILPGEEGPSALANLSCFHSPSPNVASESAHPSPPSLTPVTINPSSPGACIVTSPTPPPPVLPTIPSPPTLTSSPRSQPSDSPPLRPLPVLSPKMSPKSVENKPLFDSNENFSTEEIKEEFEDHVSEPMDATDTPLEGLPDQSLSPCPPTALEAPSKEQDVFLPAACNSPLNKSIKQDTVAETETPLQTDLAALPSQPESPSSSDSPPPALLESPPSLVSQPSPQIKVKEEPQHCEDEFPLVNHAPLAAADSSPQPAAPENLSVKTSEAEEFDSTYCKTFVCNVCEKPFNSIKELSGHITEHAADWPFKCEFCVQLFSDEAVVLAHRTTLHGVGQIFVCSVCSKEFAFLCNLQQHQKDLHPNETCTHTTVESGKLRPQNYTDPTRAKTESRPSSLPEETDESASQGDSEKVKEENDVNGDHVEDPNEELYTTIKIMASEGGKPKGPDVRLGINQHYPSFKPPPFPYHSRSHTGSVASATNFTTHNIPQTFSTAIRCTKCGNSFDNMPELHKHILVCANASDKKRYTPKKNPIPLKQIVKSPNGVASPTAATVAQNAFRRMGQPKRLNFGQETAKTKMSALSKKKNQLVQKAISQKNKAATTAKKAAVKVEGEQASSVCPHCSREFTYTASLTKHMAISCPMKPVVAKKGKKGLAQVKKESVSVVDKSTSRKKAPDDDVQTEPEVKPLKKTRARSSGAADPDSSQTSKGKTSAAVGRLKRPPSFPAPDSARKKPKKGQVQPLPPTPSTPDTPGDTAQRPAMRMQRMSKGPAAKKPAKAKPPQLKKEERLSHRKRGRVGGPVTRSLQMANSAPPAEVKTEEQPVLEPKDSQDVQMK